MIKIILNVSQKDCGLQIRNDQEIHYYEAMTERDEAEFVMRNYEAST